MTPVMTMNESSSHFDMSMMSVELSALLASIGSIVATTAHSSVNRMNAP